MGSLKFIIKDVLDITKQEKDILIELYRQLFIKIYNYDIIDSLLKVIKKDAKSIVNKNKLAKTLAENYQRAIDAIDIVNVDNRFKLFLIYDNDKLIGGARLYQISETEVSVPDIAIANLSIEKVRDIWVQAVKYAEQQSNKNGYKKMYLEIPLNDVPLLVRASKMGYREDADDIVVNQRTRTYLLNKKLERIKNVGTNNRS